MATGYGRAAYNYFGSQGGGMPFDGSTPKFPLSIPRLKGMGDPMGPVNVSHLVNNIENSLGITPRDAEWRREVDQGRRQLSYVDLREQYENRYIDIDMATLLKNTDYNDRNAFLYKVLCPPRAVNGMNFQGTDIEFFMAPFDRMNPINVARETGYRRTVYKKTLDFYKRSISAEGTLLSDPVEGPIALARMKAALEKQFELTFMAVIITAAVEIPYDRLLKKHSNPYIPTNHVRQAMMEESMVYLGGEDGRLAIGRIKQAISSTSNARDLIVPTGTIGDMGLALGEESIRSWEEVFDSDAGRFLLRAYDTGVVPAGTLDIGAGRVLRVHELSPFMGYSDDPEDLLSQPLRAYLTQGEHMMSPLPNLEDLVRSPGSMAIPKALDLVALEQSPSNIVWKRVCFAEYLKSNALFLSADGQLLDGVDNTLGSIYTADLEEAYNRTPETQLAFYNAFRAKPNSDNNNAAASYQNRHIALEDMPGFRHFDGFMSWDDVGHKVVVPKLVGDIEPKTLPPSYLMRTARVLVNALRDRVTTSKYATLYAGGSQNLAIARLFLDAFPTCRYGRGLLDPRATEAGVTMLVDFSTATHGAFDVGRGPTPPARRAFPFFNKDIKDKLKARGLFAPLATESLDAYKARVTAPALHEAIKAGTIGDSVWAHLLRHTPDASVGHLLTLAYHAQKPDAGELEADQLDAFANLCQDIAASERGHARVDKILESVVAHVDAHQTKNLGAVLRDRPAGAPWLNTGKEKAAARLERLPVSLASAVDAHFMGGADLDAGVETAHLGSFAGVFGANKGHAPTVNQEELAKNPIWQNHEKQLLLSAAEDPIVRLVYIFLLSCTFNYVTCAALAEYGLCIQRNFYVRPLIYQASDAAVLCPEGQNSWFAAYRLAQVVAGVNAVENTWSAHAQLHLGVVCRANKDDLQVRSPPPHHCFGSRSLRRLSPDLPLVLPPRAH